MSKRIMNEVMTLAEDAGLNIWYQDTDSMHINYEEVELLALSFKNKYNKLLSEISISEHKEELLNIMSQQLQDDTLVIRQELIPLRSK